MDLQLYFRVLSRFKRLIVAGLVVALSLAFLTVVRVSFSEGSVLPSAEYREQEVWESKSRIVLTQPGFPWGRSTLKTEHADANRFSALAELYAQFVKSDRVRALALQDGPLEGTFTAEAMGGTIGPLPFVTITGTASSPEAAKEAANRGTKAFRAFLAARQEAADIRPRRRVHVDVIWEARSAELLGGRGKTLPVVVFLTVMMAVIALAFVLENVRPRVRIVESEQGSITLPGSRRSA